MAKNPICPYCGKEVIRDSEDSIKNEIQGLDTRCYYHKKCHDSAQIIPKHEWPYKIQKAKIKQNERDIWAEEIYDYLLKTQRIKPNMVLIKSQMSNFEKKGYKPQGMFMSIRYFYEVSNKGKKDDKSNGGIGIVPFVYEQAKIYWETTVIKNREIGQKIAEQIEKIKQQPIKEINYNQQRRKQKRRAPSLEEIGLEDD